MQERPLTTKFSQHEFFYYKTRTRLKCDNFFVQQVYEYIHWQIGKIMYCKYCSVEYRLTLGLYPAIVPIFLSNSNCLFWRSMQCSSALCLGNMLSCYLCLSHSLLTTFNLFWDENVFAKFQLKCSLKAKFWNLDFHQSGVSP